MDELDVGTTHQHDRGGAKRRFEVLQWVDTSERHNTLSDRERTNHRRHEHTVINGSNLRLLHPEVAFPPCVRLRDGGDDVGICIDKP